jgi:hypothetical protein
MKVTSALGWIMKYPLALLLTCWLPMTVAIAAPPEANIDVLYNLPADGLCEHVPFAEKIGENSSREMVLDGYRRLLDRLADAQITHLLLNVNYQRACYPSDVWDSYWDVDDPAKNVTGWQRRMWLIHRAGVDPFAACIRYSRTKDISPWVSMRMNDTHYINDPHKANTFWTQHPEFRCSPGGGLNFALPEVRAHHLALIEEILDRYDIDGLELDWMRFCHHFKPGEAKAGCATLTEFMRQVDELAAAAGDRLGHPVSIAARVPAVPEFSHGLGLDAVAWVQKGLVDILIASSTWMPADRNTPIESWRQLIGPVPHEYHLAASMGLWVKCDPGGVAMRNDLESARGFTANMRDRGTDMIYLFNHFNMSDFEYSLVASDGSRREHNIFRELVSEATHLPNALKKPRRHILTFHDTAPPGIANPRPLPTELRSDKAIQFSIHTGPTPKTGNVTVRVGLAEQAGVWEARIGAGLNGVECRNIADLNKPGEYVPHKGGGFHYAWSAAQVAPRVVQFDVPLSAMKRGENQITLHGKKGNRLVVTWCEVYIAP